MSNDNKKSEIKCTADTMQIEINIDNLIDVNEITKEKTPYITPICENVKIDGANKEIIKKMKINPNKISDFRLLENLKELRINLYEAYEKMGVIDKEKINVSRIDIAIDCDLEFDDDDGFKFLLLIFELATFGSKYTNRWFTTNLDTLKNNTIFQKSRGEDICFYNKEEESGGRHPYKSRMEWRFKRVSTKNYEKQLDKLIFNIKSLEENLEGLEKDMAQRLMEVWDKSLKKKKENDKKGFRDFSDFVRTYHHYFYTLNILKMVYKHSGLKGNYTNWLRTFRSSNYVKMYSKKNIITYKKKMIKAIKTYKKTK